MLKLWYVAFNSVEVLYSVYSALHFFIIIIFFSFFFFFFFFSLHKSWPPPPRKSDCGDKWDSLGFISVILSLLLIFKYSIHRQAGSYLQGPRLHWGFPPDRTHSSKWPGPMLEAVLLWFTWSTSVQFQHFNLNWIKQQLTAKMIVWLGLYYSWTIIRGWSNFTEIFCFYGTYKCIVSTCAGQR